MFFKSSWDERFDPKLKMFWHNNFSTSLFSTKLSKNREWSLFFLHFLLYGTNIKMAFETILNLLCFVRHTLFPSNFSICPQHKSIKEQKNPSADRKNFPTWNFAGLSFPLLEFRTFSPLFVHTPGTNNNQEFATFLLCKTCKNICYNLREILNHLAVTDCR